MRKTGVVRCFSVTLNSMMAITIPLLMCAALAPLASSYPDHWQNGQPVGRNGTHIGKDVGRNFVGAGAAAEGIVQMDARIDMRGIVGMLADLPEIKNILFRLIEKVDLFDMSMILQAFVPHFAGLQDLCGRGFAEIQAVVRQMFQTFYESHLSSIQTKVVEMSDFVHTINLNPPSCELGPIEATFLELRERIGNQLQYIFQLETKDFAITEQQFAAIKENGLLLERILSLLEVLDKKIESAFAGPGCIVCEVLQQIYQICMQNASALAALVDLVKTIPGEIWMLVKSEGLALIISEIRGVLELDLSIQSAIGRLIGLVEALTEKSLAYFTSTHQFTIATQATLQEAVHAVQQSATTTEQALQQFAASRAFMESADCRK